jgi:hypothetical protein
LIGSPTEPSRRSDARLVFLTGASPGGVEDIDLVLVDDFPEPTDRGVVRHALEHQRRRAVGERTVDEIAVAGHPADVRGAPVDVALVIIEHVLMRHRGVDEIAAGGVDDALGRAGRARGVEDEQRILGAHLLGRTMRGDQLHRLVEPDVAVRTPADVGAGVGDDDDVLDAADLFQRGVDVGLERHLAPAAQALVRRDHDFRFGVFDPARQRVGREAAEDDRVDRADACAGQHRIGRLRDHRQIDGDAIALLDAMPFEHVGEMADPIEQLSVADMLGLAGIVAFPDDRGLVGALGEMPIDAIVGGVDDAVLEPFDRDVMGVVGGVLDPGVGFEPVDALAVLAPEPLRVGDRARVHLVVPGSVDPCALGPSGGHFVDLLGHRFLPRALAGGAFFGRQYAPSEASATSRRR